MSGGFVTGVLPASGEQLAARFETTSSGVFELRLGKPMAAGGPFRLTVSVADKAGNVARAVRTFSIAAAR